MATGRNDATNIGIGKPATIGAIYIADYGVDVPTDATSDLDDAFECLGYISDDGMTEGEDSSVEEIQAWGGDVVARPQTSFSKTYSFSCIEVNAAVLKLAYGANNVDVDKDGNVTVVRHVSGNKPNISMVVEIVLSDDRIQRIVVPLCSVTDLSDITYEDGEAVSREVEIGALPDENGVVAYDYYADTSED